MRSCCYGEDYLGLFSAEVAGIAYRCHTSLPDMWAATLSNMLRRGVPGVFLFVLKQVQQALVGYGSVVRGVVRQEHRCFCCIFF